MVTAENIRRAREKEPRKETSSKLQVGDLVFVGDPDSGIFEPRYSLNYQIIAIHSANRIEVQDEKGHKSVRRAGHVKRVEPVDKVCQQLPPEEVYKQFGRASKLLLHPKDVPDITLMDLKKSINRKEKKESRRNDSITLCELTEELNPNGKVKKSINTLFTTNIGYAVTNEQGVDRKNSEESINQLSEDAHTEENVHCINTGRPTYSNDYSEKLLNRLGDVEKCVVFPC